jgi:hypothetical protein
LSRLHVAGDNGQGAAGATKSLTLFHRSEAGDVPIDLVGEVGNSTFVSDLVLKFFDFPTKFLFIHWINKALKVDLGFVSLAHQF